MKITSRARVALAVAMALGGSAFGQTLAERVPADSVVYFGWRGTADPGPGYAGSHWAAALKESNVGKVIDDTLPAVGVTIERKWPQYGPLARGVTTALKHVIKHPSAAFLVYKDGVKWGVFCRAGKDAPQLATALQSIADAAPSARPARVIKTDTEIGLVFGFAPEETIDGGLAGEATFAKAIKQVMAEPTSVLYVNLIKARELLAETVHRNAPAENAEQFNRFIEASGLGGVNAYLSAEGFVDRDWATEAFIDAPAPRKGLLATADESPLDPGLIKRIPASSNSARVFRLDTAKLLSDTREITSAVDPQARDLFEKVIGGVKLAVGRDLTVDLLQSLGTQWAAYTSSDVGGTGGTGIVLVNRLKNPAKAKQAMVSLSLFLSNSGRNFMPDKSLTLAGRMTKVGDLQVYYAATPLLSPAWTIKDDCLYVGLYPQPVIEAARYAGASIDTVPAFAALAQPKDGHAPLAVAYTDVLRTIDDGYDSALAISRLAFGLGDMLVAPSPEPLLPTLPVLRAQAATPATSTVWADDAGLHVRGRAPFPGAEGLATTGVTTRLMNLYSAPLALSVMVPSLNRAREAANRIKSSSNLRQIGLASKMYANENRDKLPPTLGDLLRTQEIAPEVFLNPRTGHALPPVPAGEKPVDFYAGWVDENGDYAYVGSGKRADDGAGDTIIGYEKTGDITEGINVLFIDGHVEWVAFANIDALFAKSGLQPPSH